MKDAAPTREPSHVRTTDWIMTASGRRFWPLEPRVEDVDIGDIAHHLAHLCRFTGAVREFYSVAQHSVQISLALAPTLAGPSRLHDRAVWRARGLYGLLHDASEAYLVDVPRPLKRDPSFRVYRVFEERLQTVIYDAFGLTMTGEPADLKVVDRRMLRTEQRDLMPPAGPGEYRHDVAPFDSVSFAEGTWMPWRARLVFLNRFVELEGGRHAR